MNCKFKKNTICRVFGVLSSKHVFLLASLLTLGLIVWQFVVVVTVARTLLVWETVVFIFDVSLSQMMPGSVAQSS